MAAASDTKVDLLVAVYSDWHSAEADWGDFKQLVKDYRIVVDGMVLVRSLPGGKIHVDDDFQMTGRGAVGGLVVGLIFPPALLVSEPLGARVDDLVSLTTRQSIAAQAEEVLPPASSAIVVLCEALWAAPVEEALARAVRLTLHEIDRASADEVKNAAAAGGRAFA